MYTERDHRRICRGFGHLSVRYTHKLLQRASEEPLQKDTRKELKRIQTDCDACENIGAAPRRFKLTIGTEDIIPATASLETQCSWMDVL